MSSAGHPLRPFARRGLGLVELLTIVAVLVVALALMVATARHVRSSSANELTRKRLQALVNQTSRLMRRDGIDPTLALPASLDSRPEVDAFGDAPAAAEPTSNATQDADHSITSAGPPTLATAEATATPNLISLENTLQQFARESSDRLADLQGRAAASAATRPVDPAAPDLGAALLDRAPLLAGSPELRDAWGRPIALMPHEIPSVGIAPDDGPFFVSAGPDGSFLTLSDNLYSYDLPALLPASRPSATRPAA